MLNGLLTFALACQRQSKVKMRLGIVGVQFQGLLIMEDRLIHKTLLG